MIELAIGSEDRALIVSVLAAVEVRSAIRRRQLAGDTEESEADRAILMLIQQTGRMIEQPVSSSILAEASGLVDRHGLKALDSIQLASAITVRASIGKGDSIIFAASDLKLLEAATREGFVVWNPSS